MSWADVEDIFDQMGSHSGEIEAAQEWIDSDLAGTGNLRKEGNDTCAKFAQVAGKFIGSGEFLEFSAAGKYVEAELGKSIEKLVKSPADEGCRLLCIETGARVKGRQKGPDRELDFLFGKMADVFGKGSDVVQLGEKNVNGQRDAKRL